MHKFNDLRVYRNANGVETTCIFFKDINSITSVPVDSFKWHTDDGEDEFERENNSWLTLQEIGEQVRALKLSDFNVIYVWVDTPLEGYIYQTGNYPGDTSWVLHATTRGYA